MLEYFDNAEQKNVDYKSVVDFRSAEAQSLFAVRANETESATHLDMSNIYTEQGINSDIYSFEPSREDIIPVSQRKELINKALDLANVPATHANVAAVHVIVQHESGWDPRAINRTDANADAGHPSQGLMQTIPSTFHQYAPRGHNKNIHDPVSNMAAGINYAVDRYGSLQNVPGVRAVARNHDYRGY